MKPINPDISECLELVIEALYTDGEEQKQRLLEKILQELSTNNYMFLREQCENTFGEKWK